MLSLTSPITAELVAAARAQGMRLRPSVGGFPYLAEALHQAGIRTVHCDVASRTTTYRASGGAVVDQQTPLIDGLTDVAPFDRDALIAAIRRDQQGASTYDEFMAAIWNAGVITYDIDLDGRTCTYAGNNDDVYVERYAAVSLPD
jgi:uncharacterized protein YbcV (DUF1398 family)